MSKIQVDKKHRRSTGDRKIIRDNNRMYFEYTCPNIEKRRAKYGRSLVIIDKVTGDKVIFSGTQINTLKKLLVVAGEFRNLD